VNIVSKKKENMFYPIIRSLISVFKSLILFLLIKKGRNLQISMPIKVRGRRRISIEQNSTIQRNTALICGKAGILNISSDSYIGAYSQIKCTVNSSFISGMNFRLGENSSITSNSLCQIGANTNNADNCRFFARERNEDGTLIIGNNTNIGDNCIIDLTSNVNIGSHVALGPNITIYSHDHD